MNANFYLILSTLILLFTNGFRPIFDNTIRSESLRTIRLKSQKLFSSPENNAELTKTVLDDDVNGVIDEILLKLSAIAPPIKAGSKQGPISDEDNQALLRTQLQSTFKTLLDEVRSSGQGDNLKSLISTEASFLLDEISNFGSRKALDAIIPLGKMLSSTSSKQTTSIFSAEKSPTVIVYGPGLVGEKLKSMVNYLGKSVSIKLINTEFLNVMKESELAYSIRDSKSVIIAADDKIESGKGGGWFGLPTTGGSDTKYCIDSNGLKRLLNCINNERQKSSNDIKVVCLSNACKAKKSAAEFILGETFELGSDFILQCKQRSLPYTLIKCGLIIQDNEPAKSLTTKKRTPVEVDSPPIVFTRSNNVEYDERTRLSIAAEALIRAASHPSRNASISVLSLDTQSSSSSAAGFREPTSAEWDDEFLKVDGPELDRIPLLHASSRQATLRLYRIAEELQANGSGLITPIKVERYSDGVKIIFEPKEISYTSRKDELSQRNIEEKEKEEKDKESLITSAASKKSKYMSPEQEMKEEKAAASAKQATPSPSPSPKKKRAAGLEGGIEVVVDTAPYLRVRIKRCNMGPETIVKEESEKIILQKLTRGIVSLDEEYRTVSQRLSSTNTV